MRVIVKWKSPELIKIESVNQQKKKNQEENNQKVISNGRGEMSNRIIRFKGGFSKSNRLK